ncbi:MAG: hypothetical protein HY319_20265 [Armatimonadetes bacterium]|nr:hypothetical protein [Armatimonadota bacterium]
MNRADCIRVRRRGSALILVLAVTFVLSILMASVGASSTQTLRNTRQRQQALQLRHAAFSGIQKALQALTQDENLAGALTGTLPVQKEYGYRVEVINNQDGSKGNPYVLPDGTKVPAGHVYLAATGNGAGSEIVLGALAYRPPIKMVAAAFGNEKVAVTGGKVQLWNGYGSRPPEFTPPGSSASGVLSAMGMGGPPPTMSVTAKVARSALATNSTELDSLMAYGDALVAGNVTYGRGAAVAGRGGVVSVIGASSSPGATVTPWSTASQTLQTSAGLGANAFTEPSASSTAGPDLPQVPPTVTFRGSVEVSSQKVPFPRLEPPADPSSVSDDVTFDRMSSGLTTQQTASGPQVAQPVGYQPPPSVILPPGNYRNVTLTPGAAVRLTSGTYYVTDWFRLEDATLLIDDSAGPVQLYVGKGMAGVDSDVNRYGESSNFQLYFCGDTRVRNGLLSVGKSRLELTGETYMAAAAVGEELVADLRSGGFYGALMAKNVETSDFKVYHDPALENTALEQLGPWVQKNVFVKGREDSAGAWGAGDPFEEVYRSYGR